MNNENNKSSIADYDRLAIETAQSLGSAVSKAMKELQGDETFEKAFEKEAYRNLLHISLMTDYRVMKHERAKMKYEKMNISELQETLYHRLRGYYRYAACKNNELPGIDWGLEPNGIFAITLKDCAVNMEHTFRKGENDETAYTVWMQAPVPTSNDPDSDDCANKGTYSLFVGFGCEQKKSDDENKYHDIRLGGLDISELQRYTNLLRDTLADFDVIGERVMSKSEYTFNDQLRMVMLPTTVDVAPSH